MADPGFPRGGGANSPGGHQHTILPNFPKNCMKLKEFGPPGGGASKILLCRSATDEHVYIKFGYLQIQFKAQNMGVCIQGSDVRVQGSGVCIQGRGFASRGGGSASRGKTTMRYYGIQSTSGRYASYWNASLLVSK